MTTQPEQPTEIASRVAADFLERHPSETADLVKRYRDVQSGKNLVDIGGGVSMHEDYVLESGEVLRAWADQPGPDGVDK